MNPALLPLQMQRNAKDTQDMFADLANWTGEIQETDAKLKNQSAKGAKVVQQLRNKRQRAKHVVRVDSDGSEIEESGGEEEENEEEERLRMAEEFKNEGNTYFKSGKYEKAIESYTMSLSLDTSNAVFAANRAMAYMKIKKYREAEDDCTRALKHDPSYEKALFRRANCRNELGKLEGAENDYKSVLKINPKNREAKNTLEMINNRLKTNVSWTLERPKNASKIKFEGVDILEKNTPLIDTNKVVKSIEPATCIEEIEEKMKPEVVNTINEQTKDQPAELVKKDSLETVKKEEESDEPFNYQAPKNSFELERDWRSIKTYKNKAKYLQIGEPHMLAAYFAPQLPKFLVEICTTLLHHVKRESGREAISFSIDFLSAVARVPRFNTALFFLLEAEKSIIKELFDLLYSAPANLQAAFLN